MSKEKRDSQGLPENFIPEEYYKRFVIQILYSIDAEQKEIIENDFKNNPLIPMNCCHLFNNKLTRRKLIDENNILQGQGFLEKKNKDNLDFPDSYKTLPLKTQVLTMIE